MGKYQIKQEVKNQMLEEIKYYFKEERDEDLGIIGTENLYDFFLDLFGDTIYNKALDDAKKFYQRAASDMESDYYALYKDTRR